MTSCPAQLPPCSRVHVCSGWGDVTELDDITLREWGWAYAALPLCMAGGTWRAVVFPELPFPSNAGFVPAYQNLIRPWKKWDCGWGPKGRPVGELGTFLPSREKSVLYLPVSPLRPWIQELVWVFHQLILLHRNWWMSSGMWVVMENSHWDTGHRSLALGQSRRWDAESQRERPSFLVTWTTSPASCPGGDPALGGASLGLDHSGQDVELQQCKSIQPLFVTDFWRNPKRWKKQEKFKNGVCGEFETQINMTSSKGSQRWGREMGPGQFFPRPG